jgi:hypothetical protein
VAASTGGAAGAVPPCTGPLRYGPLDAAGVAAAATARSASVEPGRLAARLAEFTRAASRVVEEEHALAARRRQRQSAASTAHASAGGGIASAAAWPVGRGSRSPSPRTAAAAGGGGASRRGGDVCVPRDAKPADRRPTSALATAGGRWARSVSRSRSPA